MRPLRINQSSLSSRKMGLNLTCGTGTNQFSASDSPTWILSSFGNYPLMKVAVSLYAGRLQKADIFCSEGHQ